MEENLNKNNEVNKKISGYLLNDSYQSIGDLERLEKTKEYLKPKKIIFIDRGISEIYSGNYSFFVEQKSLIEESQNKAYQLQQKEIDIQKKYIERFRASATRSTQAKSREKQLNKISKIEAPRAKSKSPAFNFPDCPRSGKLVLNIKNLSHSFEDKILFLDVNLKICSGEKIAILGPNGCGKSTLLKIIMKKILT